MRGNALTPITRVHAMIGGVESSLLKRPALSTFHAKHMPLARAGRNERAAKLAIVGIFETPDVTGAKNVMRKNKPRSTISTPNRSHFSVGILIEVS